MAFTAKRPQRSRFMAADNAADVLAQVFDSENSDDSEDSDSDPEGMSADEESDLDREIRNGSDESR